MIRNFLAWLVLGLAMCCAPSGGIAQDYYESWSKVPADKSGLVLFLNSYLKGTAITLSGDKGEALDSTVWSSDLPLLKQYRLIPDTYRVHLPGPAQAITLNPPAGMLTFLKVERYVPPGTDDVGVQVTAWSGRSTPEIQKVFWDLVKAKSVSFSAVAIESATHNLYFSTDPPWKIPPPAPPPTPPPPE